MNTPQPQAATRRRILGPQSWTLSATCLVATVFTVLAIIAKPTWIFTMTGTRLLTIQLASTTIGTVFLAAIPFIITGLRNFTWTIACITTLGFGAFNALMSVMVVVVMLRQGWLADPDNPYDDVAFGATIPLALTAAALAVTLLRQPR